MFVDSAGGPLEWNSLIAVKVLVQRPTGSFQQDT